MAQWKKNVLEIPELYLLGRTLQTESGIQIFWPLSGIRFSYTGTHLSCEIECTYHQFPIYVAVLIDKMPVMRFPLRRGHAVYPILNGMDRKRHEIEIVRETQPVFDDPDSTFIIQSLSGSGTIFMPRRSEIHLEFIGDSITCGEGTVGAPGNQDWNTLYLSPICGYMQMLTTELQADCHVIAEGGWGLYSDWTGDPSNNIPSIYESYCALSTNGRVHYHFQWQPDAVIINLGTNDQSALNKLPESERSGRLHLLETEAVAFLHMIRKHYPNAYLLWVYGMAGQTLSGVFRYAIASAKREGLTRIGYLRLLECTPEQMGARQHPGIENHRKAKERILSYLVNNDAVHISPSKR